MLIKLAKRLRRKAAKVIVALYLFCVLAPVAAFALADGRSCLTENNHGLAQVHVHQDNVVHEHSKTDTGENDTGHDQAKNCCGLFCLSALPMSDNYTFAQTAYGSIVEPMIEAGIYGHAPTRLDRPPIPLLSL